jgi:MinD-like ATPase involved in chromosome partitioning or flagellar assembly
LFALPPVEALSFHAFEEDPVLITCWSAKGGSGTTVVAASLAVLLARSAPQGALFVDLAGDGPAVLGVAEPLGPGITEWLTATDVDAAGLERLAVPIDESLRLIPRGARDALVLAERITELAAILGASTRPVVVDAGLGDDDVAEALATVATVSLLVLRPCYLALRRAVAAPIRPSGVVLVREPGRALTRRDVEAVLGVPVRAEIDVDPAIARAVDAGLLTSRLPRGLERALRDAA